MNKYSLSLLKNEELTRLCNKSILDHGWLCQMVDATTPGSPANKHYLDRLSKEELALEAIQELLKERGQLN